MATRYTPLWIDPFENRLYAGWQNTQSAPTLVFKQGDKIDVELILLKRSLGNSVQETVDFPEDCTVRVGIGRLDTAPTGGTMVFSYGGDSTSNIPYNATVATIATAINALASITAAGGVVVSAISSTTLRIAFNSVGTRTTLSVDASGLSPTSASKVIIARAGSVSASAIYICKLSQSVCVYQDAWTDTPAPTISVETLVVNQTKRVTIAPTPISGSWTLTTTGAIAAKVEVDGDETNVPTYWGELATQRWGSFATSFTNSIGGDFYQMSVIQTDANSWDFTVKNDYEVPVGYTMPFTVSGNFTGFPSKRAYLDFNTVEVEYLLNGSATVSVVLEIEIEKSTGERWTVLQTTCTIINDLIDQGTYSPTSLETAIADAPSDGSLYGRKDGAWSVVTGGGGSGSYLPLAGGTMTGAIVFDGTSGQYISKGNFDTTRGGNYGISLVCSIGYEFNWQAGWLTTTEQGSTTPRPLYLDGLAGTTLRVWNSSTNMGTEVTQDNIILNNGGGYDSEVGCWGFGVQQSDDHTKGTTVEYNGVYTYDGPNHTSVTPTGIIFTDFTTQTTAWLDAPVDGTPYLRKDGAWSSDIDGGTY